MDELLVYCFIMGIIIIFSAGALAAFYWAARSGQFKQVGEGAASIFNEEEPIGKITDSFPGENKFNQKRVS